MERSQTERVRVTVVYAQLERQWAVRVVLDPGANVQAAIDRSGLFEAIPELRLATLEVGIFHRRCALDTLVRDGDRVEIYRPLQVEPKQARRLRAAAQKGRGVRRDSGSQT